jgi:hypothetical protein
MRNGSTKLYPGDLVEVRSPDEILSTLDADGTLDGLPFMPEMVASCGKRFRVRQRVVKTCYYTIKGSAGMRKFRADDVVTLNGERCSGAAHDGCQKGCLVFWREAWLSKVGENAPETFREINGSERLRSRLKTSTGPNTYFCQASEILRATDPLPRSQRFMKVFEDVRVGNCGTLEMIRCVAVWVYWQIHKKLFGGFAGKGEVPAESPRLKPGEKIEVKSLESITKTLGKDGHHRGLSFMPAMRKLCNQQGRVERRVERIIVDGTGEMRQLRNTVYLEDVYCGCDSVAFGGCPRNEFACWREMWLRRAEER